MTIGAARADMIARLNALFGCATKGPWKPYQDGVHPVNIGGMGSSEDYAICTGCCGQNGGNNANWIAAIHNDWPMIAELLREMGKSEAD